MALTIRRQRGSTRFDAVRRGPRRHDEESGGVSFVRHLLSNEMELEFSTLLLLTDYWPPFSLFNFAPGPISSASFSFFFFFFDEVSVSSDRDDS